MSNFTDEDENAVREPGTLPWFPFRSNRWLGSPTVHNMSLAHQAIYVKLMCGIHQHGKLSRDGRALAALLDIPFRPLVSWIEKYENKGRIIHELGCDLGDTQPLLLLSEEAPLKHYSGITQVQPKQCRCRSWILPKALDLQTLMKKSSADFGVNPAGEYITGKERKAITTVRSSSSLAESKSTTSKPEYEIELISESAKDNTPSELRDWNEDEFGISAERIRNCVKYQLDSKKNQWYEQNLSSSTLMKESFLLKLDKDTPANWAPPLPKPVLRTGGFYEQVPDPSCTRCEGKGQTWDETGLSNWCTCNKQEWVSNEVFYARG